MKYALLMLVTVLLSHIGSAAAVAAKQPAMAKLDFSKAKIIGKFGYEEREGLLRAFHKIERMSDRVDLVLIVWKEFPTAMKVYIGSEVFYFSKDGEHRWRYVHKLLQ